MNQEPAGNHAAIGKTRSFWAGFGLSCITLGIYYFVWYYRLNDELKRVGTAKDDPPLLAQVRHRP